LDLALKKIAILEHILGIKDLSNSQHSLNTRTMSAVIVITGAQGSGKTWIAEKLADLDSNTFTVVNPGIISRPSFLTGVDIWEVNTHLTHSDRPVLAVLDVRTPNQQQMSVDHCILVNNRCGAKKVADVAINIETDQEYLTDLKVALTRVHSGRM
jgi:broad-specificity NMP kinase